MTEPTYTITQAQIDECAIAAGMGNISMISRLLRSLTPNTGEPVRQYRRAFCADWYDGIPGNDGGPYETRTLYTRPQASEPSPASGEREAFDAWLTSHPEYAHCHNSAWQAWSARAMLAADEADKRPLRYRIHELEGEVVGYKRILAADAPAPVVWTEAQALGILNHFGDGPYGHDDVDDMVTMLSYIETLRPDFVFAKPAQQVAPPPIPAPQECKTEAEKTAYAFGWWKALEAAHINKASTAQQVAFTEHTNPVHHSASPKQEHLRDVVEHCRAVNAALNLWTASAQRGDEPSPCPVSFAQQVAVPQTDMRAAFERDFIGDGTSASHTLDRLGDGYRFMTTNIAWTTWQRAWAVAPQPPQAVPMTDERIDAILDAPGNLLYVIADKRERLRLFASAIEAHHGITK